MSSVETTSSIITPITPADFPAIDRLAETIWRSHYVSMISMAQIDYMLAGRYTPQKLQRYLAAQDCWMMLLKVSGTPAGYCSYALIENPSEMKLQELYLLPEHQGKGLGGLMLRHVETEARSRGCKVLSLTVNKGNTGSIGYLPQGWVHRARRSCIRYWQRLCDGRLCDGKDFVISLT